MARGPSNRPAALPQSGHADHYAVAPLEIGVAGLERGCRPSASRESRKFRHGSSHADRQHADAPSSAAEYPPPSRLPRLVAAVAAEGTPLAPCASLCTWQLAQCRVSIFAGKAQGAAQPAVQARPAAQAGSTAPGVVVGASGRQLTHSRIVSNHNTTPRARSAQRIEHSEHSPQGMAPNSRD